VSLRPEWTGIVVPSKFFGSLAAGRPVIFAGSRQSAIAGWIQEHQVGWVLDAESEEAIGTQLLTLAADRNNLAALQSHCHAVYQRHFSRQRVMSAWDRELHGLLL
jgi:colanic acid biosynthesis glycosyl transferase WcaI